MNGLTKDQINWRKHGRSECPDCGIKINPDYNEGTSGCILCFDEGRYARSIHDDGQPHQLNAMSKCHHCNCPIDPDDPDDGLVVDEVFFCENCASKLDDVVAILPQDEVYLDLDDIIAIAPEDDPFYRR